MDKFKHIVVIDSLRGFAALFVALFHFVWTTVDFVDSEWVRTIFHQGRLGVQIFFVISGVVIPLSLINGNFRYNYVGRFLMKRVIRIEPPYLATLIIALLFILFRNAVLPADQHVEFPDAGIIFAHLGYLVPFFDDMRWVNQVFWTLAVEFQYYIIIMILTPFMLSNNLFKRIAFYAIILTMPFIIESHRFFFHWGSLFLMGISLALYIKERIDIKEFLLVLSASTIFSAAYLDLPDAIAGIITVGLIYFIPTWKSKPTLFLGKISYSLYLVHPIFGSAVVNYLSHKVDQPYEKFAVVLLGTSIAIFTAYLMYYFVERPSQKASKKLNYSEDK